MNILGVGFYDDFARFFYTLKSEASKRNIKFNYITIFFSGFFYGLIKFSFFPWLTLIVWCRFLTHRKYYYHISKGDEYKGIEIVKLINYHISYDCNHEAYFRAVACAYIDYAFSYLMQKEIDVLIVSGDSRIQCVAFIEVAKILGVRIYYFEQGAFDTTFIDTIGVNANSVVREIGRRASVKYSSHTDVLSLTVNKKKNKKFKRVRIFRGMDKVLNLLLRYVFPYSEITEKFPKSQFHGESFFVVNDYIKDPYVLFAAQVPHDVNMISHSPVFANHSGIMKFIHNNVPDKYKVVVREHPLYKGRYEKEFYDFIDSEDRFILDNKTPLHDVIKQASLVIVNNSTVGIESIALGTRVFVTGAAYYDTFSGIWSISNPSHIESLKYGEYSLSESLYQASLNDLALLFNDYLYAGHFRDDDLSYTSEIVEDIINGDVKSGKANMVYQSSDL